MALLDLKTLEWYALEQGFAAYHDGNTLLIELSLEVTLKFANMPDQDDNLIGFLKTDWHTHGCLAVMTAHDRGKEFGPIDILDGLRSGELLIADELKDGKLAGRSICHRDWLEGGEWLEPGSELRFSRIR